MMAKEYKKRGGEYNTDKSEQDESQKHLSKWSEEEWQTKDGSGDAKQEDGTRKRYLPKEAWENMEEEEKEKTDQKKQQGSKEGKQFVGNTNKAKQERKRANGKENERFEKKKAGEQKGKGGQKKGQNEQNRSTKGKRGQDGREDGEEGEDDSEHGAAEGDDGEGEYQDDGEADEDEDGAEEPEDDADDGEDENVEREDGDGDEKQDDKENAQTGQKRKQSGDKQANGSTKKQKSGGNAPKGTVGSKHMPDEEPAPRGSADRLPKKGQSITWKAMPGFVEGKVTEVLTRGRKVDGKEVKASKDDPKIVMTSNSSGKVCVHKPDACFYD